MPRFIVLEGCDLTGKSLQAQRLKKWFETERGESCLVTQEPNGTKLGNHIRKLLSTHQDLNENTRVLLFYAARVEHIKRLKQATSHWIVADRYFLSTEVYQQNASKGLLKLLRTAIAETLMPDLWLILDGDFATLQNRNSDSRTDDLAHLEQTDQTRWNNLRQSYLEAAKKLANAKIIDANPPIDEVFANIQTAIQTRFAL